ncbi:MAG: L,D-transpeptidase family protein [Pyrinomonadaceae bacterium]
MNKNGYGRRALLLFCAFLFISSVFSSISFGQYFMVDIERNSARSDILTGGKIEKAEFTAGRSELKLTVNVPAFQMTLWQDGKEISTYKVGVGLKDYPIYIGKRPIKSVIWNPSWIPPDSEWVAPELRGKVISPTDPANPLGKIKIPLGYNYLIHQAKGVQDLGNLVSHGCLRVMRDDLYELNDRIIAAYSLDVSVEQISKAKRSKETFIVELSEELPIEITYDTVVIEKGILHIYPDVYDYKKNGVKILRDELNANGIENAQIPDATIEKMIGLAKPKNQYIISVEKLREGDYLSGKVVPVLDLKTPKRPVRRKR